MNIANTPNRLQQNNNWKIGADRSRRSFFTPRRVGLDRAKLIYIEASTPSEPWDADMFVDLSNCAWVSILEHATQDILNEFCALPPEAFAPWPERHLYGQGWSAFGFRFLGHDFEENKRRCPKTAAALAAVPGLMSAGISVLEPGTWIKPHIGYSHSLYVGHLGLIIPDNCALRVGSETRNWSPGQFFAFNDMVDHEAWNRGTSRRVVLLIEYLRPGRRLADFNASPEVQNMLKSLGSSVAIPD